MKKKKNIFKNNLKSRAFWLYIRNGKPHPIGIASLVKYKKYMPPLLETKLIYPLSMVWDISNLSKKEIQNQVLNYYHDLINSKIYFSGRYGDWIKCTEISIEHGKRLIKYLKIDLIGEGAWNKPTLAADLGIFIKKKK